MKRTALVIALFLPLFACNAPPAIGRLEQPIINGTIDTGDPNIVLVYAHVPGAMGGFLCTGEIVSPHVVLTAAHCMAPSSVGAGSKFIVFTGNTLGMTAPPPEQVLQVSESHYLPTFFYNDMTGADMDDVGVLILAQPTTIAPLTYNHFPLPQTAKGSPVRIVGYGLTDGTNTAVDTSGTKHEAPTKLFDFGGNVAQLFDGAHSNCEGDSGGPALLMLDGKERIISITQVGYVGCPVMMSGEDTLIDPYASFVDKYVDMFDPPKVGPGGACTQDSDCGALPCINKICAVPCDPMAKTSTCPSGTTCSSVDGKEMCAKGGHGCAMGGDGAGGGMLGVALAIVWLAVRRRRGLLRTA